MRITACPVGKGQRLKNAVVARRGQFVILFIDGDWKAAQKAVDSLF